MTKSSTVLCELTRRFLKREDFHEIFPLTAKLPEKAFCFAQGLAIQKCVGFREFALLADLMLCRGARNVHTLLEILSIKMSRDLRVLENFFLVLFEILSVAVPAFKPNFRPLYFHLAGREAEFSTKFFCDFVTTTFPQASRLISSFFSQKFLQMKPTHNRFKFSKFPPESFLPISSLFALYLSNPQYCFGKRVQPFLLYSSHAKAVALPSDPRCLNRPSNRRRQVARLHFREASPSASKIAQLDPKTLSPDGKNRKRKPDKLI